MSAQVAKLRAQLSQLAHNYGVLAFNRAQAELVWQAEGEPVIREMRNINVQIMALEQADAEEATLSKSRDDAAALEEAALGPNFANRQAASLAAAAVANQEPTA